jgi:hypothetical protein
MNRDEVDAERQLRLGGDVPEEIFLAREGLMKSEKSDEND